VKGGTGVGKITRRRERGGRKVGREGRREKGED
jgi:hypothetical protein